MTNHDKTQNLAHWLNYQALLVNKSKKHFFPCERVRVIIDLQREEVPFMEILSQANLTPCHCHNNLTVNDMLDYSFDDRAKKVHYGDA